MPDERTRTASLPIAWWLTLSLGVGLVAALLVAWGAGLRAPFATSYGMMVNAPAAGYGLDEIPILYKGSPERFGVDVFELSAIGPGTVVTRDEANTGLSGVRMVVNDVEQRARVPGWAPRSFEGDGNTMFMAQGFPMRCLSVASDGNGILTGGLRVGSGVGTGAGTRVLALRPVWVGLVVNSLTYGLALFLPVVAVRAGRQALRRRRGACLGCGYDLTDVVGAGGTAGAVCPECGVTPGS